MEISSTVFFRPFPSTYGAARADFQSSKPSFSFGVVARSSGELRFTTQQNSRNWKPARRLDAIFNSGFRDNVHLQYYYMGPSCGEKKEKDKVKKILKRLQGLRRRSHINHGLHLDDAFVVPPEGKLVSETEEELLIQLQQLKLEEKEQKRKRKLEKAKLKRSAQMQSSTLDCESSSSESSNSECGSDRECGDVIAMNRLRREPHGPLILDQDGIILSSPSLESEEETIAKEQGINFAYNAQNNEEECCVRTRTSTSCINGIVQNEYPSETRALQKRIEVCLGKKCKKSGAEALLKEFERVLGVADQCNAVFGCKCMGQCRDGPNVKVSIALDGIPYMGPDDSVTTPADPLLIGVNLEDVSMIVAKFMGDQGL